MPILGNINKFKNKNALITQKNEIIDYNLSTYQTSNEEIFSLHAGWNLISYIGQNQQELDPDLDEVLPDDIEMLFTDIMSENIVAMRNEETGEWVGSLANIGWQQLKGYWVYVTEDLEFTGFGANAHVIIFCEEKIIDNLRDSITSILTYYGGVAYLSEAVPL